ncbi:hypothetical protein INT80_04710 [Gallibacterium anatis]|uniref:Ppx/GppA phosphatase C-terminal domain-containing protein n=1 Tax=Gallibacterium anatis TaxID=750 RepID=A0A930UUG8_9PAST|nr:hypothetical protein [Gallibacterium anatis]
MPGFDNEQQRLLAIWRVFIPALSALRNIPDCYRYNNDDVLALILLLRLAVIFNKARQATEPAEIGLQNKKRSTVATFPKHYLEHNPLLNSDLQQEQNSSPLWGSFLIINKNIRVLFADLYPYAFQFICVIKQLKYHTELSFVAGIAGAVKRDSSVPRKSIVPNRGC